MKKFFIALAKFIGYGGAQGLVDPSRVEGRDRPRVRTIVIEGKRRSWTF